MINLQKRSHQKELLDAGDIPFEDIRQNMKELDMVNTLLGGHAITLTGIRQFSKSIPSSGTLSVCEIGSGGGDNLNAISKWGMKKNIRMDFTGIDIKKECTQYARQQYPSLNCKWVTSDYASVGFENRKPDIVFSSLFCHHFNEEELVEMIHWMKQNSRLGFFFNDLQRHPLAYHLIKWITRIFSRSYLVKNDAPLSVARAFTKKEWEWIFEKAGIRSYTIQWKWAFRYLIVCKNTDLP
jgi:2-polyprenyl-3-methyl-5-hydroxy-6-metoxy-1,4-benzoquinol methylase